MAASLRVSNLWKSYTAGVRGCSARVWALRGCTLQVDSADRIAIAGRPGSGKTTLLQCMAHLRVPDAGSVTSDFSRVLYISSFPLPLIRQSSRDRTLLLIDDLAVDQHVHGRSILDELGDCPAAMVIATRHLHAIAPIVHQSYVLREGRLVALPRTPVRRVAERSLSAQPDAFGRHESSDPETVRA